MSVETKKVLEMLASGKISQEDAERLLDKLSGAGQSTNTDSANSQAKAGERNTSASAGAAGTKRPRFLHIEVQRPGRDNVDVRVPLSMARGGKHWMAFLPTEVAEKLTEYGIHFGALDEMTDSEFQASLDRINVDVVKGNGKRVRVYAD